MDDLRPTELEQLPIDHLMRMAGREVEEDDADAPVPFLVPLHERPVREVFERAAALVNDSDATRRILGMRVLRELGEQQPDGCRPFTAETVPLLRDQLRKESDPDVLPWIVSSLGFTVPGRRCPRSQHLPGIRTRGCGSTSRRI
jgi:hypothetical protein